MLSIAAMAAIQVAPTNRLWHPARPERSGVEPETLQLTQALMERQLQILAQRLKELQPSRPGAIGR